MRILLVEDSRNLSQTLVSILEKEHYIVDPVYDGQEAYAAASSGIYDIIILDLMLPQMDGYEVLHRLREDDNMIPVMILSARSELEDKIRGFEIGADDYLTKPFEPQELIMRIRAICRRHNGTMKVNTLQHGNLELNLDTCTISNRDTGRSVKLGGTEFQLIEYFLRNKDCILSRDKIIDKIWGFDSKNEYNNVEVYISFLRKKLTFLQTNAFIRTTRNVGYSLEVEND